MDYFKHNFVPLILAVVHGNLGPALDIPNTEKVS